MDTRNHPSWCTSTACTAYGVKGDDSDRYERWHRSEPLMVRTDVPAVGLCIHKFAEADGTDEHIELALVELPVVRAWYLAEPVRGYTVLLRAQTAAALVRAVTQLV